MHSGRIAVWLLTGNRLLYGGEMWDNESPQILIILLEIQEVDINLASEGSVVHVPAYFLIKIFYFEDKIGLMSLVFVLAVFPTLKFLRTFLSIHVPLPAFIS